MIKLKKNLIILIIVILLVAGGVGYYLYKTSTLKETLSICDKIDDENERKYCSRVVRGEGEKCEKEDCYIMIAARNQDPDLCKNISEPDREILCKAFADRDPTRCEIMTREMRPICYLYVALLIEDLKGCEESISPNFCKAIITKDPTFCGQISGLSDVYGNKENCYYKLGAINGDLTLCEYVTDIGKRKACQKIATRDISGLTCKGKENKVCSFIAALEQDLSICETTSLQGECYTMIVFPKIGIMPKSFPIAIEDVLPSLTVTKEEEKKVEEPVDETADWSVYQNEKYGYSFEYPKGVRLIERDNEGCVELGERKEAKGWPDIEILHYDTPYYNPPGDAEFIDWVKKYFVGTEGIIKEEFELDGVPAVKIYFRGANSDIEGDILNWRDWATEKICYFKDGRIFLIGMSDVDSQGGKEFYNLFLSTFKFTE